jgi:hypothetical protein
MIQIIAKFYEVHNHILNMNNCTIPIIIEKFDLCDFTKKSKQVFHLNEHKCVEKNILLKSYFHLKMTRIMLEVFISKFNLYVYQNAK